MISNDLAQQLHDKATRGDVISPDELSQLKEWYAIQDQNESTQFEISVSKKSNSTLQVQIKDTLNQIGIISKRIQTINSENEILRQEITDLRREFTQTATLELV